MHNHPGVKHDVAEVFRKHLSEYRRFHRLSSEQAKAVQAIVDCRTPAMGGVVKMCSACQKWEFCYKPCKNRHCPQCGTFEKAQWLEAQKIWLLPIPYYHVVFTIDHVFNPLVAYNAEFLYSLLIQTAAQLLKEYGRKYLGGEIGFSLVLHTWGQTMQFHPHLHVMVTGGALVYPTGTMSTSSTQRVSGPDGYRWQAASREFLFPVKLLSHDFRERFCAAVARAWQAGTLETQEGQFDVAAMVSAAQAKDWEVFIQAPLSGAENLLDYLGRYIFRIAISNHRLVAVERDHVSFEYYDNREQGQRKLMRLAPSEFIRRFLSHVLPSHFVRIRHFGLHHSTCRSKLQHARRLLGLSFQLPVLLKLKFLDWFQKIMQTDQDPRLCPYCKIGLMMPVREFPPVSGWRRTLVSLVGRLTQWKPAFA